VLELERPENGSAHPVAACRSRDRDAAPDADTSMRSRRPRGAGAAMSRAARPSRRSGRTLSGVTKQPLSLARVFASWWPLAASWAFMGVEMPLVSAVMARLADPEIHLAAYGGIVFPVALIIEAPIIMLLAASTALGRDPQAYRLMHRFMMVAGGLLTAVHAIFAFTPAFDTILVPLLGPPEAVIEPAFAISATLGEGATRHGRKSPGNRSKAVAMLREQLIKAREYGEKTSSEEGTGASRDLALEALASVLAREMPLVVEVHRHNDIMTALRLADEFEFDLVLAGVADAQLVMDEIKAAGVPVILHPTMVRAWGGSDMANFSFTTAAKLTDAGIPVALQSGYEGYVPKTRVVLFEAGVLLGYGVSRTQALQMITLVPARILGIDDRVGSLEPGKHGDLALFDGDPFEYTSHVLGTVIEGRRVSDKVR